MKTEKEEAWQHQHLRWKVGDLSKKVFFFPLDLKLICLGTQYYIVEGIFLFVLNGNL